MKLSITSLTILALAGLSLAQDNWSSSSSSSSASSSPTPAAVAASSSASPSATSGPSGSSNSTSPNVAIDASNSTTSLASNSTGSDAGSGISSSSAKNVTLPTAVNGTSGPAIQPNTAVNVTVPSTDTQSCSTFLTALNSDSDLQSCLAPTLKALESDTVSISTFCNVTASQACPSSTIRRYLAYFAGNCSEELASGDKNVLPLYDALYLLTPITQAACARDTNGNYCAAAPAGAGNQTSGNGTSLSGNGGAANVGQQPLGVNGLPNADAFNAQNVAFLGANPSLDEQSLCTTCTRNVLTSYFTFEASTPYTGGLTKSALLGTQNTLYSAVQTKCPADFLSSALDNAGAAPGSMNGAVDSYTPGKGLISLVAIVASLLSL